MASDSDLQIEAKDPETLISDFESFVFIFPCVFFLCTFFLFPFSFFFIPVHTNERAI